MTIRNKEIARLLGAIADLLELIGESTFRIRAYREAARHIESMPEDIAHIHEEGRLREIPGVGESLAAKIDEYLRTGVLAYYEDLKKQVAPGLGELLEVPGLGPRRAKLINAELGITSVAELERAARDHRLRDLRGFAEKTEEKILLELSRLRERTQRHLLATVVPVAEQITSRLRQTPAVQRCDAAGSLRRMKETIGDLDILAASLQPEEVMRAFVALPFVREVLVEGGTKCSVLASGGLQIDLRVIRPDEYGAALQYFTGSKEHNIAIRAIAIQNGMKLSEYGIFDDKTGERLAGASEEEIYRILGMDWIPPELREARGEIAAALEHRLPRLVEPTDIRGDLHVHTNWTDGKDTLRDMVEAAIERGYRYVAITDHSVGLGVARGLSVERVREQRRAIAQLNVEFAPFRVLHGIEAEIRRDGTIDYGEEVLAGFDVVTASVHSGFAQPIGEMTERILRAVRNPLVDVFNHPTGRLIGKRPGYEVDLEAVIRAARESGTAIEINSQIDRLDLTDIWARRAKEEGVMLAINTDAHSRDELDCLRYGLATARRAWIEPRDVLNALPLDELLARLHPAGRVA